VSHFVTSGEGTLQPPAGEGREMGGRGRRQEGDGSGGSPPCSGSPLAQDDDTTDGIFPTREEESFCSRAGVVDARGFGPGTNLRKGLNKCNFSSGPVFDPRPGVPRGSVRVLGRVGDKALSGSSARTLNVQLQ
jgi:hypothetical protein